MRQATSNSSGIRARLRTVGWVGVLGGLGGALNAFWCWAKFPVAASDGMNFSWTIIPAGLCHGALLAVVLMVCILMCRGRSALLRWLGLPLTGWLAGWLSFIPLHLYIRSTTSGMHDTGLTGQEIVRTLWPFTWDVESLWTPYPQFGLVAAISYGLLVLCRQLSAARLARHLVIGGLSGALGSLWWWISYQPWYFSVLHGTIWGSLVGFGVWDSQRQKVSDTSAALRSV